MKLKKITKSQKNLLERLLQLYLHDVSLFFPIDFDEDNGLYLYDDLELYFESSENIGYFIKDDNNTLGFILISISENENQVQELFVLNQHKSKGIGKLVVNDILDKYDGNWVIKSLPCSEPAERFWEKTIKNYTNNNYNVEHIGKYNRAVFSFNNKV